MSSGAATVTPVGPGVWQVTAGTFSSNCYLHSAAPGTCVVIDPGLDPQAIDEQVTALGLKPLAVLCTHGHFDHVGGASHFQARYGVPVYLPQADAATAKASNFLLMALRIPARITLADFTPVAPGPVTVRAGDADYRYVPCPGHTPGSSIICIGGYGFSGDSIYARGVGLSKLPGENHAQLKASLQALWTSLPGDMTLCPGHGPAATWDTIRETNTALRDFLAVQHVTGNT